MGRGAAVGGIVRATVAAVVAVAAAFVVGGPVAGVVGAAALVVGPVVTVVSGADGGVDAAASRLCEAPEPHAASRTPRQRTVSVVLPAVRMTWTLRRKDPEGFPVGASGGMLGR